MSENKIGITRPNLIAKTTVLIARGIDLSWFEKLNDTAN
jgi:hypothetical protein